jgi:hypothetical protein
MSNPSLPAMHYLTEPERAQVHPAVIRSISIPSIPPEFPFNTPISEQRRNRGPRYIIGWVEFQSPEQPDPEVARPGDVWIQLPSGHRKARVYACYSAQGKDWSPWAGNNVTLGGRGNTPMHPFLNDHAQRRFFLVFNGSEFTWSNPKGVSIILHTNPQMATVGPAEAVIKWLKVTGVGRTSPAAIEGVVRSTSAPLDSRKHAHPDHIESAGDSASAPPAKKPKNNISLRPETPPLQHLAVKLGTYAKAGATQQGWIMSIDDMPLHMPFPCINCTRTKSPCSGIPGERCGRCRFKRLGCSHHTQKPRGHTRTPANEAAKLAAESSITAPAAQPGLTLRLPPLRPAWGPGSAADAARSEDANKAPGRSAKRRVRIRSSSYSASNLYLKKRRKKNSFRNTPSLAVYNSDDDDDDDNRSSSPLSSVHDPSDPVPLHSETAILDERDDADVEHLLDSTSMNVSAMPAPAAEGSAAEKTLPQIEAGGDVGEDEDEELAHFMQMTLDGMSRVQEGLRGVFAQTCRRLMVKRAASAAQQAAGAGRGAAAAAAAVASANARVLAGDVSAPH